MLAFPLLRMRTLLHAILCCTPPAAVRRSPCTRGTHHGARARMQISKVQQCAIAIMKMVGTKTVYERQIRETLGNNPDTSKALRL